MLALALAFALAACTKAEEPEKTAVVQPIDGTDAPVTPAGEPDPAPLSPGLPTTPEVTPTPEDFDEPDYEEQLWLIADMYELWGLPEGEYDAAMYAVTDLDSNGRLELILATTSGSGMFSTNRYLEVIEDRKGLDTVIDEWSEEGNSQPDIMNDSWTAYDLDGVRWYVVEDIVRNGYADTWLIKSAQSLHNGVLTHRPLVSSHFTAEFNEAGELVESTEYTFGDTVITEEDFNALGHAFDGLTPVTVTPGWVEINEDDDVFEVLAQSFNTWNGQ